MIKGNVHYALERLIAGLVEEKYTNPLARSLLAEWDINRGDDWFTSTLSREEKCELLELERLKMKYE